MALLTDLFGIKSEMRKRVDEVLKAGAEWNKTAQNLTDTLKELTKAIYEGKAQPEALKPLGPSIKNLGKQTSNLAKAFTSYQQTLNKIAGKYG